MGNLNALIDILKMLASTLGFNSIGNISFDIPSGLMFFNDLKAFNAGNIKEPNARACCAIGWETSLSISPSYFATDPMRFSDLGGHKFGGPASSIFISSDNVGHIYTKKGGIIDIGHVRDHADITRYLAIMIRRNFENGGTITLSDEGGERKLEIIAQGNPPSPQICTILAAKISYELSIWHEIITQYNWQLYSSFSPEDNFSNLLGCYVGYQALLNKEMNYEEGLDLALAQAIVLLGIVEEEITTKAVDYVKHVWYTYLGSGLRLLRRHFDVLPVVTPWLIQDVVVPGKTAVLNEIRAATGTPTATSITVPAKGPQNEDLNGYYNLKFKVDSGAIPAQILSGLGNQLTQHQLKEVVQRIRAKLLIATPHMDRPEYV